MLRDTPTPGEPVGLIIAARASLDAPSISDSVQSPEVTEAVATPAIAVSRREVILLFTTDPHVPVSSPGTGKANPNSDVYAVVMFLTYVLIKTQLEVCDVSTEPQLAVCVVDILPQFAVCVSSICSHKLRHVTTSTA